MKNIKTLIEREFDAFFEFETDNRDVVTSTSAKLFAEHVVGLCDPAEQRCEGFQMNKHKLVPMEPTEAMIDAAHKIHEGERYLPTILYTDIYKAMLAAAPAVQGEPVGWQYYQDGKWWHGDDRIKDHRKNTEEAGYLTRDVYAAPQPAPEVAGLLTLLEHAQCNTCDGSGALYDGHGQVRQCQWCHERSEALAAHREQGGEV